MLSRVAILLFVAAFAFPVRFPLDVAGFRSASLLDVFIAFGAIPLALKCAARGDVDLGARGIATCLVVPAVVSLVSLFWSADPTMTVRHSIIYAEGLVAYLLTIELFRRTTLVEVESTLAALVGAILVGAALGWMEVDGFGPPVEGLRPYSVEHVNLVTSFYARLSHPFYGLSNNLATVLVPFTPFFLGLHRYRPSAKTALAAAIVSSAVLLTLSRGVAASLVLGIVAFLVLEVQRARSSSLVTLLSVVVAATAIWVAYTSNETLERHAIDRLSLNSIMDRSSKLEAALSRILGAPWLGYGAGVIWDFDTDLSGGVHNAFVEQLLHFGIPLGVVVGASLVSIPVLVSRMRGVPLTIRRGLWIGLSCELATFLTQASYEGSLLRVVFHVHVALAVVIARAARSDALDRDVRRGTSSLAGHSTPRGLVFAPQWAALR